jgi:energy-coupling factor transporter ATP-binding protein EcfA2
MRLTEVKLKNYRAYRDEVSVTIENLTVIVGRNDAGKSTILDALDLFFNDSDIEREDACVHGDPADVRITCVFSDLPDEIILDEQHPTTLQREYLVRQDGQLEICRVYNCSSAKGKQVRIFARADHPTREGCSDLLALKIKELKARASEQNVALQGANQSIKTDLRAAIWSQTADLMLAPTEVDLSAETGKTAWDQIRLHLPVYALFKSDRASTDQDAEAQDPMKAAIKETVKKHEAQLNGIIDQVKNELERVAKKTVEKIQEMSPALANTLTPQVKNKNWDSLFSVSLSGEDGIAINKRGSGTRRLVLLNFFRAKAEDAATSRGTGTIYAVEEPETSQHPIHQLMLLDAFQELTGQNHAQVILTTHTPTLARKVDRNYLRLVLVENGHPKVLHGNEDSTLQTIKSTLGVLPDHDVKAFLGVEGKWDIEFLKRISKIIHFSNPAVPDLESAESSGALVFIPLGGSSMELWTARLAGLDRPEFYLTDRDTPPPANPKYHAQHAVWNARPNCTVFCTNKRELENYLHPDAIKLVAPSFPDAIAAFDDVPLMLAEVLHSADPHSSPWGALAPEKRKEKAGRAKRRLNQECVGNMTVSLLAESDPDGEVVQWLSALGEQLTQ